MERKGKSEGNLSSSLSFSAMKRISKINEDNSKKKRAYFGTEAYGTGEANKINKINKNLAFLSILFFQ